MPNVIKSLIFLPGRRGQFAPGSSFNPHIFFKIQIKTPVSLCISPLQVLESPEVSKRKNVFGSKQNYRVFKEVLGIMGSKDFEY